MNAPTASVAPAISSVRLGRGLLFVFSLPAILQGFLHAPAQSLLQGIYAKHVGVPLAALGIAVLIARVFDGIVDPFIGAAADAWRRRTGSHKAFIGAGTLVTVVGLWNLFRPPEDAGAYYFAAWYMVASFGWSLTEIPYKSWSMQLSAEYVMRTRIQTWLAVGAVGGTILFYLVPLAAKTSGQADTTEFNLPTLAFAAVLVVVLMPLVNFLALWRMPDGVPQPKAQRIPVRELWRAVVGNGPFVYFTLMFFLSGLTSGINQGVNYLFVDGYLGLGLQLAGIMLLAGPAMLLAIPVWGVLSQIWERQKVWAFSLAIVGICQAAYAFIPPGPAGLMPVTVLTVTIFLFIPCIFVAGPAMVGDLIDYGNLKFGHDHGGIYIAVFSVVAMAVNGLGAALGLILLDALGYDATVAEQTAQGVFAMQAVAAWIPALGTLIAVPLVWRYPLNRARHDTILAQLAARGTGPADASGATFDPTWGKRAAQRHPVHADYRKVPSHAFEYGRFMIWLINALARWDRRRKCATPTPGVHREHLAIPNAEGGTFPSLLMRPVDAAPGAPILLYFHGGAFVFTYGTLHIQLCERYARDAGCIVILVDYRLAPRDPFPAGFNDCFRSMQWAIANAAAVGGDGERVAVMGDSAGGTLAAGVAQKALDEGIALRGQLLIYPAVDSQCTTASIRDFEHTPLLSGASARRMWPVYLKGNDGVPDSASPAARKNLRGLPPTYIDTAEFDPLRDEGINYAHALEAQGVDVTLNQTRATIHGFELAPRNPETVRSIENRIAFLKRIFGGVSCM